MDLDLESRKTDHGTPTCLCNPSRDRETGSKGKYVHRDSDRRTRSRSVFKARPGLMRTADLLAS